jgi:hypothetical protein
MALLLEIVDLPGECPSPLVRYLLGHCTRIDLLADRQRSLYRGNRGEGRIRV